MMGTFQTTVMVHRRVHDAPVFAPGQQRVRLHVYDVHVSARGRRAVRCGFVTTAVRCDPYFPYGTYGFDLLEGLADSPTVLLTDAQAVTDGSHMEWLNREARWWAAKYAMAPPARVQAVDGTYGLDGNGEGGLGYAGYILMSRNRRGGALG